MVSQPQTLESRSLYPKCFGCVHTQSHLPLPHIAESNSGVRKKCSKRCDPLPWLCSKSSSYPVCAFSSCHTVLRHELVETEIGECGKHNHVYTNQDLRILGNISLQETELQQLTQHLHEPMVEMNLELKNVQACGKRVKPSSSKSKSLLKTFHI